MKKNPIKSFEQLLQLTEGLTKPKLENDRDVHWCEIHHTIGFSRQLNGSIELFLCGDELLAISPLVKRHLRFDQWTRSGGEIFKANRLVFPSDEHYTAATAFLAEELLRNNVVTSLQNGFSQTEPLIEMMLRRTALNEDEMLGLLGELRFLDVLLTVASDSTQKAIALDSWRGHEQASRDFVFGLASVEVKTTRGDRSVHHINSLMQVDPRRSESDQPVEQLHLLSIGLKPMLQGESQMIGISLPSIVNEILEKLGSTSIDDQRNELQNLFLNKVSNYGTLTGHGYVHNEMHKWPIYQNNWQHGFLRIYDMNDEAVQILKRRDVQRRAHVVFDSVKFSIDLPDRITGELNPQNDLFLFAKKLIN